jgi:hypothetical protein
MFTVSLMDRSIAPSIRDLRVHGAVLKQEKETKPVSLSYPNTSVCLGI